MRYTFPYSRSTLPYEVFIRHLKGHSGQSKTLALLNVESVCDKTDEIFSRA